MPDRNFRTTTIVLEDDFLELEGWRNVLARIPTFHLIGIYQRPEEAEQKCKESPPDLLIVDGYIDGKMDAGAAFVNRIRQLCPDTKILGVSRYREALDYLKPVCDHVVDKRAFERHVQIALRTERPRTPPLPSQQLTSEEHQVLKLMAQDKKIREIADAMGRTEKEIKRIRTRLYDKLGVCTDHGAVGVGYATGLLKSEDILQE